MIEVHDVTKRFKDRKISVTALNYVSLMIEKRETVGLISESDAGKTTLLRTKSTQLSPTKEKVQVNNNDTELNPEKIKKYIGVLFGGETRLYDRITAKENLEYFASLNVMSKHETKVRIDESAKMLGII